MRLGGCSSEPSVAAATACGTEMGRGMGSLQRSQLMRTALLLTVFISAMAELQPPSSSSAVDEARVQAVCSDMCGASNSTAPPPGYSHQRRGTDHVCRLRMLAMRVGTRDLTPAFDVYDLEERRTVGRHSCHCTLPQRPLSLSALLPGGWSCG